MTRHDAGPKVLRRNTLAAVIAAALVLVAAAMFVVRASMQRTSATTTMSGPTGATARYASAFLRDWVDADGRVVRRDQGGDTVSEGQAYGLLIALAMGDRAAFDRIWSWTRQHLQLPDGALAWRWSDGRVADRQPASDADVDTATALLRAGSAFDDHALTAAGARIGDTVLRSDTVAAGSGRLLAAGPWAVNGTTTVYVDPDYIVAGTADLLARDTGQSGWNRVASAVSVMQHELLTRDALPPDWVTTVRGGAADTVSPVPQPGSAGGPVYGLSAPRLLIRLAASCRAADRRLAADANDAVTAASAPAIRALDGTATVQWRHPVTAVAAAAVLTARGDTAAASRAMASAAMIQRRSETYYGAAWLALGSILLDSHGLGSCAGEPG